MDNLLTPRWYRLKPHGGQDALWHSKARFIVLPCGRRSGKSEIAKRKLVLAALDPDSGYPDANYFAAAPTRDQAKRIYWKDLRALIPNMLITKANESELLIQLYNGSSIHVLGMDKPERLEGSPWNGGILDEYANMKQKAWVENVRPALSDRNGWCWLIGVPEGRNHYYELYQFALSEESGPEWAAFSWKSAEILPEHEIASARATLDELTFQQEYEASFVTFKGRCYYPFLRETHTASLRQLYNPKAPLIFCFDFNVEPGVAAVCQEAKLPNGLEGTAVIGEVHIPHNSNTPAVCRRLIQDWGQHKGPIICYGDATGGSKGSAKVSGSDWDLIRAEFRQAGINARFEVPQFNPPERARINAVNTRLRNGAGEIRLMVDREFARNVTLDFEGVILLEGGSGEIDKRATPKLTHMCFARGTKIQTDAGIYEIQNAPFNGKAKIWAATFENYKGPYLAIKNSDIVSVCISNGDIIKCTPDHLFLTDKGWICAKDLTGMKLMTPELLRLSVIQSRYFLGFPTSGLTGLKDISDELQTLVNSICTGLYGNIIMARSQLDIMSTTLTETEVIIKSQILNCRKRIATCLSTIRQFRQNWLKEDDEFLMKRATRPQCGTGAKQEESGTDNMRDSRRRQNMNAYVAGAVRSLWQNLPEQNIVQEIARQEPDTIRAWITRFVIAKIAEGNSAQTGMQAHAFAEENALRVIAVKREPNEDVFCITVPNAGCFCLANEAIVSNSDALGYYIVRRFPLGDRRGSATVTVSASKGDYYV